MPYTTSRDKSGKVTISYYNTPSVTSSKAGSSVTYSQGGGKVTNTPNTASSSSNNSSSSNSKSSSSSSNNVFSVNTLGNQGQSLKSGGYITSSGVKTTDRSVAEKDARSITSKGSLVSTVINKIKEVVTKNKISKTASNIKETAKIQTQQKKEEAEKIKELTQKVKETQTKSTANKLYGEMKNPQVLLANIMGTQKFVEQQNKNMNLMNEKVKSQENKLINTEIPKMEYLKKEMETIANKYNNLNIKDKNSETGLELESKYYDLSKEFNNQVKITQEENNILQGLYDKRLEIAKGQIEMQDYLELPIKTRQQLDNLNNELEQKKYEYKKKYKYSAQAEEAQEKKSELRERYKHGDWKDKVGTSIERLQQETGLYADDKWYKLETPYALKQVYGLGAGNYNLGTGKDWMIDKEIGVIKKIPLPTDTFETGRRYKSFLADTFGDTQKLVTNKPQLIPMVYGAEVTAPAMGFWGGTAVGGTMGMIETSEAGDMIRRGMYERSRDPNIYISNKDYKEYKDVLTYGYKPFIGSWMPVIGSDHTTYGSPAERETGYNDLTKYLITQKGKTYEEASKIAYEVLNRNRADNSAEFVALGNMGRYTNLMGEKGVTAAEELLKKKGANANAMWIKTRLMGMPTASAIEGASFTEKMIDYRYNRDATNKELLTGAGWGAVTGTGAQLLIEAPYLKSVNPDGTLKITKRGNIKYKKRWKTNRFRKPIIIRITILRNRHNGSSKRYRNRIRKKQNKIK